MVDPASGPAARPDRDASWGAAGGLLANPRCVFRYPSGASLAQPDAAVETGRCVDVQHPHRPAAVIAEAVLDARGRQDERAGWRRHVFVAERERHLALDDVERVVLAVVDVRLEDAPGGDLDDPEGEPRGVDGAGQELDVPDPVTFAGRHDDRLGLHAADPSRALSPR